MKDLELSKVVNDNNLSRAGTEPPEGCTLQLGYKENAQELRSSTEELDLQDPVHEQDQKCNSKRLRKRAKEVHDGTQSEHGSTIKVQNDRERKDSNCSEIILLNISGRTSRLSSVGSQGSGVSGGALSVVSATSSRLVALHCSKCLSGILKILCRFGNKLGV
jgi:hypothetical protein